MSDRLLQSFWMAGYEGADHRNGSGTALSLLSATAHDRRAEEDYRAASELGLRSVRESLGWRNATRDGDLDLSGCLLRAEAARRAGIQILWTLCHYGWPDGIDPFSSEFVHAFRGFARTAALALAPYHDRYPPIYNPINEISFLSWAITETGLIHPYRGDLQDRGYELKQQLVRATIAACDAILEVDPRARFLHVDPIIHVLPPVDQPELVELAQSFRARQFQAWDMLCGRAEPHLGGHPRYLDLVGVNYYHANQWEFGTGRCLYWHLRDPRRIPFHELLIEVHARYRRPLLVSETSHVGEGRGLWLRDIGAETLKADHRGVPVLGICIYPAIDRPDWEDPQRWHESGLWDVASQAGGTSERTLNRRYAAALMRVRRRTASLTRRPSRKDVMESLIVFSHLRWDFVYQRPQQVLSRLAKRYKILFVEEPLYHAGDPWAETQVPLANVTVLRPHTPQNVPAFHDDQIQLLQKLIAETVEREGLGCYGVWLYTPMALPLLQGLTPRIVIYDCMDELTGFAAAPRQLVQRENALLKIANVVFTGGPSLYEGRRGRHENLHCFPSSVDCEHFAQARNSAMTHADMRRLGKPRLGFFGVIDERMDIELLREIARRRPEWHFCMVGPVVKIDPTTLPVAPNLHYYGQQPYAALPAFVAGWDICLMPFARNEATRFISPTKTLEYMAAETPIVSTSIPDVLKLYAPVVNFGDTPDEFLDACERALAESESQQEGRRALMRSITSRSSWDKTVMQMATLIDAAARTGLTEAARAMLEAPPIPKLRDPHDQLPSYAPCVVLGGGPTGLSAGYHYGAGSVIVEKEATVGGWCRSIEDKGFTFDHAGHIMFSNDAYVQELYRLLLGDNIHWQNREAWIFSQGVYTRYPFQGALYGLPPDVLKECLIGAIEARFGRLRDGSPATAEMSDDRDCCADGTGVTGGELATSAPSDKPNHGNNFEEFIQRTWGAGVAKYFALPYNRKLWTVPLTEMETSWLGGRVPLPDLEAMIEGALRPVGKPMGPNARFGYPLRGGFQALMTGFLPLLRGELHLNAAVTRVSPTQQVVTLADGRRYRYDTLISTLPLPQLIAAMGDEAPLEIHEAARRLRHVSIRCVNIGVGRRVTDKHWIYYPEATVFHRVFVQGNASPYCNPPEGMGLTCEISYSPLKPLPADGDELVRRCIRDCVDVGLIRDDDPILTTNQVDMPIAYVVYDHDRAKNVQQIRDWLAQYDIILAGRFSEWEYYNSDHAFLAGKRASAVALNHAVKHIAAKIA